MTKNVLTESYAFWAETSPNIIPFARQIDNILSACVYYPEEEWGIYNFRPPENNDLLGAWRSQDGEVFVFLLAGPSRKSTPERPDYLVLVSGKAASVKAVGQLIVSHKGSLEKIQRQDIAERKAGENFSAEIKTKSIQYFVTLLAIFTAVVSALSFYLRTLPTPEIHEELLLKTYRWVITLVYFGALCILVLILAIGFVFLVKLGLLLIRRRK